MSSQPLVIGKFSLGMGDRFAHEAEAQLAACLAAKQLGVEIVPVWNKSNREHNIIGSEPTSTRIAADAAVKALGWTAPYFLDADHIGLKTVDRFVGVSDFFTIDVADFIAQPADPARSRPSSIATPNSSAPSPWPVSTVRSRLPARTSSARPRSSSSRCRKLVRSIVTSPR